jgi:cell division septal protein FtsQ
MLFRRKAKNRRFRRGHVLDVKVSSTVRRQTRWRRLSLGVGVALALFFGLFAAWQGGEWLLRRFVYENPAFSIHRLDVETDGVIALEQLRTWAGVRLRDNILALDINRVKRDLEMVPSVERASVERVLPHTVRIRVTEREPVARVPFPKGSAGSNGLAATAYTLDANGVFMFPLDRQSFTVPPATNDHLPVITGLGATEMRPGRRADSAQVQAALRLVRAFDQSPMAGLVELKQVDVSQPGLLVVTTSQSNEVHFGLVDLEQQLRRWRAVHDHGVKSGRGLAWLDLSVANNVPARWAEAGFLPPPAARVPKPSPYRKKNA